MRDVGHQIQKKDIRRNAFNYSQTGKTAALCIFFFGAGATCWVIWQTTTFLGIVLGFVRGQHLILSENYMFDQ